MISNFSEEASEILANAKLEMLELNHPYVGTEHLVLAILHSDNEIKIRLAKYGLTYQKFKNEILNTTNQFLLFLSLNIDIFSLLQLST